MQQTLINPVGKVYKYSDLSMITLHFIIGEIVKNQNLVTQSSLLPNCPLTTPGYQTCYYEAFVRTHLFTTADMSSTGFLPPDPTKCAPTYNSPYIHKVLQGVVMDGNAYANGGIMGHAGLFSTVGDIQREMYKVMFPVKGEYIDSQTTDSDI